MASTGTFLEMPTPRPASNRTSADFELFGGLGHGLNADPAMDDFFGADLTQFTSFPHPSNMSTSTRTVSPKDLQADFSAPPSAAFTNLTSPDTSPAYMMSGSFDTSPMYKNLDGGSGDDWYPLFSEDTQGITSQNNSFSHPLERNPSAQSLAQSSGTSGANSPIVLDQSNRRKSSSNNSPALNAGITKPRRRRNPLPSITVDPNDKAAVKRARNTLAARDSRQRKFEHVEQLNNEINALKEQLAAYAAENEQLKAQILNSALTDTS